ncbi:putative delta-9 desaturase 1-like protein [Leptotrombidium deliense]|uniref:Putative delta-9 desaturase 1-like protein n=1 Tax=Leptotrombidium deliense TaxID=299467 RepID=A0A443S861_9ACAR|nr:putative delta-9 desaturase 1-like protein [Leptotrombidium deliense]
MFIFTCSSYINHFHSNIVFFSKQGILYWFSGFGGTAGAHRFWTHRSFKANFKLRLLLCYFNCTCYIVSVC